MNFEQKLFAVLLIVACLLPAFLGIPRKYVARNKYLWWVCLGFIIGGISMDSMTISLGGFVVGCRSSYRLARADVPWLWEKP